MNKELRSTTHVVRCAGVQFIRVGISLVGEHIAKRVSSLRKGALIFNALAAGVISARARGTTAAICGIDIGAVIRSSIKMMAALAVCVRSPSGKVQREHYLLLITHRRIDVEVSAIG